MAKSESDGATSVDTARELTRALRSDASEITIDSAQLTTVILGKYRDRIRPLAEEERDPHRVRAAPAAPPPPRVISPAGGAFAPKMPGAPRPPPYRPAALAAAPCAAPTTAPRRGVYGKSLALAALAMIVVVLAVAYFMLAAPPPRGVPLPQTGVTAPPPLPPSSGTAPQGVIGALPVPAAPSSGGSAAFPVPPWSLVALVGMVLFYLVLRQLLKQESYEIDASWQIYQVKGKLKLVKVKAVAARVKVDASP